MGSIDDEEAFREYMRNDESNWPGYRHESIARGEMDAYRCPSCAVQKSDNGELCWNCTRDLELDAPWLTPRGGATDG